MTNPPENPVDHNPLNKRFEIKKDGYLAVLEYQLAGGKIIFTHAGVPQAIGSQGLGSRLAAAGLDYARAQGLKVVPLCSFVAAYIQKHPETRDLAE